MNCRDFRVCSRTLYPFDGRKKAPTSNTCNHRKATGALRDCTPKTGRSLVPVVHTLGSSDDGDDWKHIIMSSDVTALKGMLLPSQVTLRPFPRHFSPVLSSRLHPLSFNYLPLLLAQLRPVVSDTVPNRDSDHNSLFQFQNCTKQQKRKGKKKFEICS